VDDYAGAEWRRVEHSEHVCTNGDTFKMSKFRLVEPSAPAAVDPADLHRKVIARG
jgi:hypothetical protein